jgi:peroxiredoxin
MRNVPGYLTLLFLLLALIAPAQNITIKGAAEGYKGKEISASIYDDLITYRPVKQAATTIGSDGTFELKVNTPAVQRMFLSIENKKAHLYASPGSSYEVVFPVPDTAEYHNPNVEELVNLNWKFRDTLDLNALIIHYNMFFEYFYSNHYEYFVTGKAFVVLDSFRVQAKDRYKNVKNEYFQSYIEYNIASLRASFSRNEKSVLKDISKRAVLERNYEYMDLFNYAFKDHFQKLLLSPRAQKLAAAINELNSYTALNEVLAKDEMLANDTLRELVMLKGLRDAYNTGDFRKENIQDILGQIAVNSKISEHRKIASNISHMFTSLDLGSIAPEFELPDKTGKLVSLSGFKDKYIYISFFTSECTVCQQELKAIPDLKKQFGDKVVFISISLDENIDAMKSFLEKNPKYNWYFLYAGNDPKIREDYGIKTSPVFFLVNTFGKLERYPAASPSQGIEDVLKQIFKKKEKTTIPGQK